TIATPTATAFSCPQPTGYGHRAADAALSSVLGCYRQRRARDLQFSASIDPTDSAGLRPLCPLWMSWRRSSRGAAGVEARNCRHPIPPRAGRLAVQRGSRGLRRTREGAQRDRLVPRRAGCSSSLCSHSLRSRRCRGAERTTDMPQRLKCRFPARAKDGTIHEVLAYVGAINTAAVVG